MTLALQGIRVLDLTDAVAGPFCTMMLSSYGAEVIRIESLRHLGFRSATSPNKDLSFREVDKKTLMTTNFARFSLDKLSASLNLTKPEAQEIFKQLVKQCDVVVDNLSFGILANWGLDYETLRKIKEDIIVVAMPSLGRGPHQEWTTWGMNLLSYSGFAYSWAHADTPVEERVASNYYGDYIAGMETASAIMAALYHKAQTGEGQYLEVAQAEVTASLLGPIYLDSLVNKRVPPPKGNRHAEFAPYNGYRCKGEDRWCVIAVRNEKEWKSLCSALGSPAWTKDEKFKDMASRLQNVKELNERIETWTKQHTPIQVMRMLQAAGAPAGAVQNGEELFYDIQLRSRGHMIDIEMEKEGCVSFDGSPIRLKNGQKTKPDRAPLIGEQNDYVFKELLGMSQQEIDGLIDKRVIY